MHALISMLLFSLPVVQQVQPKSMPAPPLPFEDWKACPFETCAYGEWTFARELTVFDTWKEPRREITKISAGERVTGVTGVVITIEPGVVRMDRDLPLQHLRTGDLILTYADRGEGFSAVWFKDKYYPEFDLSFAKLPDGTGCGGAHCAATYVNLGKKAWWAQIKFSSGRSGWILVNPGGMKILQRTGA